MRKKNNDRDGTTVRRHLVFLLDLPIVIIGKIYSWMDSPPVGHRHTIDQAPDDFRFDILQALVLGVGEETGVLE